MINTHNSFVTTGILLEVDDAREAFGKFELSDAISKMLEQESNSHSDMIEHPHTEKGKRMLYANPNTKTGKTFKKLSDAWKFATTNYSGKLSREFVEDIARIIVEGNPDIACGYRRDNVRVTGYDAVQPPRCEKVPHQMDRLFEAINDWGLHPVDKALATHLHVARIHPFIDGNGRTARLLQNLVLQHEGFAPATVKVGERTFYQDLLRDAIRGYQDREATGKEITNEQQLLVYGITPKEKKFYDFMASKIMLSYEHGIRTAESIPEYSIELGSRVKDRGAIYTLERLFKSYLRKSGKPFQVKITDNDKGAYRITGNITPEVIAGIFVKAQHFYDGSYHLERKIRPESESPFESK